MGRSQAIGLAAAVAALLFVGSPEVGAWATGAGAQGTLSSEVLADPRSMVGQAGDAAWTVRGQRPPTATSEPGRPATKPGLADPATPTSTPMRGISREREDLPDTSDSAPTPTRTPQPEPPEICRTRTGEPMPCGQLPGDDDEPGDGQGDLPCLMVLDVASGNIEEASKACEEFMDSLPASTPLSTGSGLLNPGAGRRAVFLKSYSVSADLVELAASSTIGQVQVHVERGENDSWVQLPPALGMQPLRFTVATMSWEDWWHPDVTEYPNDINSSEARLQVRDRTDSYPRGYLEIIVEFEQDEREILGTWHGEMDDMRLRARLPLRVVANRIMYGDVDTHFGFDLNMIGIADWAADEVFEYSEKIQEKVETSVTEIFDDGYVRGAFSQRITEMVQELLEPDAVIMGVMVNDGQLTVRYYLE